MKTVKKAYYYFFYKIYYSIEYTSELSGGKFLTAFKASLVMIVIELWLLISFGAYYVTYIKKSIELSITMPIVYIPLLIVIGFNYFTLDYKDTWKKYKTEFDELPRNKNRLGGWLVFILILLIICNFIYSFYIMSQMNKSLHS